MASMADAFKKAGIDKSDFSENNVDEKIVNDDLEISFLEGWLKLLERGASAKEKFRYVQKHGFLSEMHLSLYLSVKDDDAYAWQKRCVTIRRRCCET